MKRNAKFHVLKTPKLINKQMIFNEFKSNINVLTNLCLVLVNFLAESIQLWLDYLVGDWKSARNSYFDYSHYKTATACYMMIPRLFAMMMKKMRMKLWEQREKGGDEDDEDN